MLSDAEITAQNRNPGYEQLPYTPTIVQNQTAIVLSQN